MKNIYSKIENIFKEINFKILFKSILFRTTILAWFLIILSLALYIITIIPYQRTMVVDRMNSEAKDIANSIGQVTATAIITEDYSFAVDHCLKVLKGSRSILFIVITRHDGFSLILTTKGWKQDNLKGKWRDTVLTSKPQGQFIFSDLINKEVFQYSHPFAYSGIEWGIIHIGLSLDKYNESMNDIINRAIFLALLSITFGLGASYYFTRKLIYPIKILDNVTRSIAEGDLSARVEISTGDELESLAVSFNKMTETLQRSQMEIISSHEFMDNIIKSLNDTLIVVDPDGIIKRVNRATINLLGYKEEELIGQPVTIIFPEAHYRNFSARKYLIKNIVESETAGNFERNYKSKSGKFIPVLFSVSVIKSKHGKIEGFVCIALDITDRKHFENALQDSQERYKAIVEDQTELICRFLPNYSIIFVNEAYSKYYDLEYKKITENELFIFKPLTDEAFFKEKLNHLLPGDPVTTFESSDEINKNIRWQQWTIRALFDNFGRLKEYQATGRDITEKKLIDEEIKQLNISLEKRVFDRTSELEASLKEKEVMLKEIHHRVKNNLQIISSLLNLQSNNIKDKDDLSLFNESQDRVKSMAMIHEMLYRSKDLGKIDFSEYLKKLVSSLIRSYNLKRNISIQLDIKDVYLNIDTAIPCGLIINELVTNSLKYAFPESVSGNISVSVEQNKKLKIFVEDNGIGLPEDVNFANTHTLGLRLVKILAKQLNGEVNLIRNGSTKFIISI